MGNNVLADILDVDARGIGQALTAVALGITVVLFVAVLIPVAILTRGSVPVPTFAPRSNPTTTDSSATNPLVGGMPVPRPVPPPVDAVGRSSSAAVDVAYRYLGVPYVFGGTNPSVGLDCSGLVQLVFRQLGIGLPRTAQLQYNATTRVPPEQLRPGDLVFFERTYADPNDWITHVGIYIGNGQQINAPTEGQTVSIQAVFTGFWGAHFASGGRVSIGYAP